MGREEEGGGRGRGRYLCGHLSIIEVIYFACYSSVECLHGGAIIRD